MRSLLTSATEARLRKGLELATRLGASAAKLLLRHRDKVQCEFEAGNVKSAGSQETLVCTAEVVIGATPERSHGRSEGTANATPKASRGRRGTSTGNRLDDLSTIIERAVAVAKAAGSAAHFDAYPAPAEATAVQTHSKRTLAFSTDQMIDASRRIDERLKAYDHDIHLRAKAERVEGESLVVTTGGVCHPAQRTSWLLFVEAQQTRGTDIVIPYIFRDWGDLNETYDPDAMAEQAVIDFRRSETIVEPPSGRVKAYLPPEALEMMLWPLQMGIDGRNVAKGESPLGGRLGEQVLAPTLTIIDNPHQPFAPGACSVDDDGIPTRRQTLFDKGVLRQFLYDLDTAGLANTEPTGNNGCRPHNVMIQPGKRPSDELLRSIDDGLFIRSGIGFGGPGFINGDISCNVGLGFRVKNGQIVGRVKDTMIAGNVYELLAKNVELSSDLDYSGRLPHAVIEGLAVSSKGD